ncbi:MAG TPA: hypothetical protein VHC70_10895, partial [Phycisphaerales bacterium]|nr:hypothetical protein [Phycisphaerales bacterium]
VTDAKGQVLRFVDIWFHDPSGLVQRMLSAEGALNNILLDERWHSWIARVERSGSGLIEHGDRSRRASPWIVDFTGSAPACVVAASEGGSPWELCTNDAELASRGEPAYSTTTRRMLCAKAGDGSVLSVPAGDVGVDEALGLSAKRIGVNLGASFWAVTPHCPLSLQQMGEWLGARPVEEVFGILTGSAAAQANGSPTGLAAGELGVGLLTERADELGASVPERLHLKLRLLLDAVSAVQDLAARDDAPLLSIRTGSFAVDAAGIGEGLPWAWTARAHLLETGPAPAIPIRGGQGRYFVPQPEWLRSEFSPSEGSSRESEARLRIASVTAGDKGVELDALLETSSALVVESCDLIQIGLVVGGRSITLYGKAKPAKVRTRNELAITTLQEPLPESVYNDLVAAKAKNIPGVQVSVLQVLGTPADLWSMGAVAMGVLLATKDHPLTETLSHMRSLAVRVSEDGVDQPLDQRVHGVLKKDAELRRLLGPHRLLWNASPPDVSGAIPPDLWARVIASLVRAMPGYPDCPFQELGSAGAATPRHVFHQFRQDLYTLVCASRGLIFSSAGPDAEIAGLLRKKLVELGD